ncbi:MAG TPA: DUF4870 domain-containing protein [Thermoflexia bacterium]|nr:DUF4870 domain-containing protein [Thermoflexia bacterium]
MSTSHQPPPLSPSDERTWAMLAHLTVLLNPISGLMGVVGALVIYLVFQNRSRYVAYQSLQAVVFQLIFWVGGGILAGITWAASALLSVVLVGLLCFPVALILTLVPLGAIVYGIIGGIQCSQGQDFRYWLIGDWVQNALME